MHTINTPLVFGTDGKDEQQKWVLDRTLAVFKEQGSICEKFKEPEMRKKAFNYVIETTKL